MARTPLKTAALALVLLLGTAASASASTASFTPVSYPNGRDAGDRDPSFITVKGGAQANSVVFSLVRNSALVDDGAGITAGRRCTQITATRVACPVPESVDMRLGAGDDSADDGGFASSDIDGGAGADTITSSGTMLGGPGADTLTVRPGTQPGQGGPQRLEGGTGDDRLVGGPNDEILLGDAGHDRIEAGAGDDVMFGDDLVEHTVESDYLDGGPGSDTVDFFDRRTPVTFDLSDDQPEGVAGENETILSVENVVGGAAGDRLVGGPEANRFDGGPGRDTITTGGGDDFFVDDGESDALVNLGAGTDRVSYAAVGGEARVEVDLSDGRPDGPRAAKDPLVGVEDVTGSPGPDLLVGDRNDNVLVGGDGDDEIHGRRGDDVVLGDAAVPGGAFAPGDDRLHGGPGDDQLVGGESDDLLDGGWGDDELVGYGGKGRDAYEGVDLADYSGRYRRVAVDLGSGSGGERGEVDTYVGLAGAIGGRGADTLIGSTGADILTGNGGRDLIDGRGGPDRLSGGAAGDLIEARDGVVDQVDCGPGRDRGRADRSDRLKGCERQLRRG
ncbi:MAG: hypothetical protein QOG63_52 [Thermoleophilaceae bacterium]|nr:hypothetical protein [Thermoleophilaceae bacterium]